MSTLKAAFNCSSANGSRDVGYIDKAKAVDKLVNEGSQVLKGNVGGSLFAPRGYHL